jgi:hypothetical protein
LKTISKGGRTMSVSTATLSLGIATLLVTGYIAWQQWQTARNKFRLELFDRRFPVYEATMKLAVALGKQGICTQEEFDEFVIATKGVRFLFNQKLEDYCETLRKRAIAVITANQNLDALPTHEERAKSGEYLDQRRSWFNDQLDEIPKRFKRFLKTRG